MSYLIGIVIYLITIYINNYLKVNCNFYANSVYMCTNDYDLFIAKIRRIIFFLFGNLYLIIFSISENISIV